MPQWPLELLAQAHEYAQEYLTSLAERRVYPDAESLASLSAFEEPLPASPSDPEDVLRLLHEAGSPATVAQSGGRYFGFVNGGAYPVGLAARWLADAWDQNTAHYVMSPIASKLEDICESWLVDLLKLPTGTSAGFVTGTTLANLTGLAAGRNALLKKRGWDVGKQGLYGAPPVRVLVGASAHAAVHKSLALLGMGDLYTEIVPADEHGRLQFSALPHLDQPALVVTQAGNVNTGAFDPIGAVCDATHAAGGWVHVDGAFGLWAGASEALLPHYGGIEKADSWAVDAHKTLNVPYDCGIALCRDREAHLEALRASASYFQWSTDRDPMNYTPSMSKRARAVELWAVLKTLGRQGVEALVDQLCEHARLLASRLEQFGFRVHNDVVFNQVLVSGKNDDETLRALETVQGGGQIWCGASSWNGHAVIRLSVCSWATTSEDIERAAQVLAAARDGSHD